MSTPRAMSKRDWVMLKALLDAATVVVLKGASQIEKRETPGVFLSRDEVRALRYYLEYPDFTDAPKHYSQVLESARAKLEAGTP